MLVWGVTKHEVIGTVKYNTETRLGKVKGQYKWWLKHPPLKRLNKANIQRIANEQKKERWEWFTMTQT